MIISIFTGPWLPVPAIQGGAVNRRWQGMAEQFAAKGHKVRILCRSYPGQPPTETINGVEYIRQGGFPQSSRITIDLVKDLVYALQTLPTLPRSDILVINDFWLPVFAALRPNVGRIVFNAARFPKWQYFLYSKVDRFEAVSQSVKNAILRQYPTALYKTNVIPNPIDTNIFSPSISPKLEREEKVILFVGRLHPEKGIHLLLDAFKILLQRNCNVKLKIIGPYKENQGGGGKKYFHTIQAKAQGLNVEICDPIFDVHRLVEAYRSADLFCYPSLAEQGESFGIAPLEAMATGLVPIISDLDCFKDFIQNNETGYFFNHRTDKAAENLASVINSAFLNSEKTHSMSVCASKKAQEYSYQTVAELYLEDFERLIHHHRS